MRRNLRTIPKPDMSDKTSIRLCQPKHISYSGAKSNKWACSQARTSLQIDCTDWGYSWKALCLCHPKHILFANSSDLLLSNMQRYCRLILGPSFDTWVQDIPKAHFEPEARSRHIFLACGFVYNDENDVLLVFSVIHIILTNIILLTSPAVFSVPWYPTVP